MEPTPSTSSTSVNQTTGHQLETGQKRSRSKEQQQPVAPLPSSAPMDPSMPITLAVGVSSPAAPLSEAKVSTPVPTSKPSSSGEGGAKPSIIAPVNFPASGGTSPNNSAASPTTFPAAPAPMVRIKTKSSHTSPLSATVPPPSSTFSKIGTPTTPATGSTMARAVTAPTVTRAASAATLPRANSAVTLPLTTPKPSGIAGAGPAPFPNNKGPTPQQLAFADKISKPITDALMCDAGADKADGAKAAGRKIAEAVCLRKEASTMVKTLHTHLKDPKNVDLRERLRSGSLTAEELVEMDPIELANPEQQKKMAEVRAEVMRNRNWVELKKSLQSSTKMFQCFKCKSRDCNLVSHKQTRGGDEPMTARLQCNNCGQVFRREA